MGGSKRRSEGRVKPNDAVLRKPAPNNKKTAEILRKLSMTIVFCETISRVGAGCFNSLKLRLFEL